MKEKEIDPEIMDRLIRYHEMLADLHKILRHYPDFLEEEAIAFALELKLGDKLREFADTRQLEKLDPRNQYH